MVEFCIELYIKIFIDCHLEYYPRVQKLHFSKVNNLQSVQKNYFTFTG